MNIVDKRKYLEDKFVSSQFGLIKDIKEIHGYKDRIQTHVAISDVAEVDFIGDESGFATSGLSLKSKDEAIVAAIMEGLERYSATIIPEKELREYSNLNTEKTKDFLEKFGCNSIEAEDLTYTLFKDIKGEEIFLPAQYAYFQISRLDEKPIIHNTTNGLAAHSSREKAREAAFLELIEREAILRTWINGIAPPQIELEGTSFEEIKQSLAEENLELTLFQINLTPEINISLALLVDKEHRKSLLSVGAGADFDMRESVSSAIEECLQTRIWEENYYDTQPTKPDQITDTFDRSRYWASETSEEKFRFLYQSNKEVEMKGRDPKSAIENLDLPKIYFKDVTTSSLADKGVYIFRAFCPEFNPFYLDEEKGKSSNYLCKGKTIIDGVRTQEDLNRTPHPML